MAVNKIVYNTENGAQTLIDLTSDTVTAETLAEGETAHDASGNVITGTMPTSMVLYTEQSLTEGQQAQARANIGITGTGADGLCIYYSSATPEQTSTMTVNTSDITVPDGYSLKVGDLVLMSGYLYKISSIADSTVTLAYMYYLKGSDGTDGTDGKTAYEYAVDGGYTGTEEQFAEQLADGYIPDYVKTEAEDVISRVIAAQSGRTFTFAAITDMHYGSWGYYEGITDYPDGIKHACQALKYIDERIKLDAVAVLGDYTDGMAETQESTAVYDFKGVNAVLDKLRFAPNLRLVGNHDFHAEHSPLTYRYIGAYNDGAVEWGNFLGGYFRKDFDTQKVRIICLNTSEQNNTSVSPTAEQYQWLISSLDLSAKEDSSEWQILILSHIPLDMWANNGEYKFAYILNAYQTGGTWSDDNGVSCDFTSGNNAAKIIANIHGHTHNFKVDKLYLGNIESSTTQANVWRMATPNSCFGKENKDYTGYQEDTAYTKTADSVTDTAFCIYCINLDDYTIKAICYGAGYDRELTYYSEPSEPVYTNQIPISTDVDGNIYNTVGYKANTRYSTSSNTEKEYTGVYITGYIPVSWNDVVRLRNITFVDGGEQGKIHYFAEKGTWQFVRTVSAHDDSVLDENGNLIQFSADSDGYIRIQGSSIDETSIITVNEPIE